jgi:transcription initiation factor TFIIB
MLKTEDAYHQRLIQKGKCPECNESEFVTDSDSGELVCFNCGLVLKDVMLDQRAEWRAYTHDDVKAKARAGPPISYSYYDKGLSTTFQTSRDPYGKRLSSQTRLKMTRLRKWDNRAKVHSSINRNLSQAMTELERLADTLHLPKSVKDEAALIYRKALEAGLVRGRAIASIVAASIYAACRFTETPRKIKEIVEASSKSRKEITRCYRLVVRNLDLKMPNMNPEIYISKIASKVGLDQKTQLKAMEVLRNAKKVQAILGKGPAGIAAAALYIASHDNPKKITQKHLADAAGVTEVTVRNRYKRLVKDLQLKLK